MNRLLNCLILLLLNVKNGENLLCSEEFCQNYREQKSCLVPNSACQVQNSTYSGELFPADVPCNCCSVCLQHLDQGEFCTKGSPDSEPPLFVCGPGLTCEKSKNDEKYRCTKMERKQCLKDQEMYDQRKLTKAFSYTHRPTCDGDGNYGPVKCNKGQTCFCVDEDGNRIFGESIHNKTVELTMNCECARLQAKISKWSWLKHPISFARCLADGSFDPMQCTNNDCICVERETGSPNGKKYKISEVKYSSLPCYNKYIHRSYTYLHDCEQNQWDLINELRPSEEGRFVPFAEDIPHCQPDGWFPPVQEDDDAKFCVDKYGKEIEPYRIPKNSPRNEIMNCRCARTSNLLKQNKIANELKCCPNGNFEHIQCRGDLCYCVDENGLQISSEKPRSQRAQLACYNRGKLC